MTIVTISPKFQVVIPKQIRESLKLEPGQKVQAIEHDNRVELIPLRPITEMPIRNIFSIRSTWF